MSQPDAILLLAHGTPDVLSEMAEYLSKVTNGRPLPAAVVEELQHRYAEIGLQETPLPDGPPLTRLTLQQSRMLADELEIPVYVGMRNWHPYIADVVTQMRADGVRHFKAICLAPQNSRTSVGLYRSVTAKAAAEEPAMQMDFVAGWAEHPLLAAAFAERLWPAWAEACATTGRRVPVLFTAHSVPCRTIMMGTVQSATSPSAEPGRPVPAEGIQNYGARTEPDPYPVEAKRTAALVAQALAPVGMTDRDWYFAFQSQGVAGGPWIGPTVEDTFKALVAEGHTAVVMQPIGFLCDHVEILYDIDIAFAETGRELGLKVSRAESLNASEPLIRALKTIAEGTYKADVEELAGA
ncbi:ferrochelatase [Granulicella tundricola]|uniref:Ferrochelatase n=1 Tax=Granulicella tundricola (strain ATCC BAA-1859 / DSM 23138 / MP5ACTX9) TaxID=1198114 RepID=E8X3F1_GRATM|nr:ferrochelatase [Granulicella tundricola]ADW70452.1 ferrochelatase [Granulicella tundricola MP5ACTX9]